MGSSEKWFIEEFKGLKLVRFKHLLQFPELLHFVTTRVGGISAGPADSLNIGFHEHDKPENVIKNRKILAEALGISMDSFVFSRQTHSNHFQIATAEISGKGVLLKEDAIQDNDAFIVQETDICPIAMTADCTPVILYDPVRKVAAVIHAGWKGTVKQITRNVIKTMCNDFRTNPKDVLAGIGPSNGPCCYEVGDDVMDEVKKVFPGLENKLLLYSGKPKPTFNMWEANKIQLIEEGVKDVNIVICDSCTFHNPDLYFSARYNNAKTGRMGAGIMIRS